MTGQRAGPPLAEALASGALRGLSSVSLPEGSALRRGLPAGVQLASPGPLPGYDDTTLIYDCFSRPGRVVAYLPKMLGFEPLLRNARYFLDDRPVSPRFSRFRLFDRLSIPCAGAPRTLTIDLGAQILQLAITPAEPELFAGENCLYTIQKDQDVAWICDWLRFHIREQGATAALICDNASTRQTPAELLEALRHVPGLRRVVVVAVPFSWGPVARVERRHGRTKFLQAAMMNLMRERFLTDARAVLNCDVDELFLREGPQSCFDRAAGGLGYVSMGGEWRYAAQASGPVRHVDHWMQAADPPGIATKYCAAPQRLLGRLTWGIHGLEGLNRRLVPVARDFRMIHCRNISTSWKVARGVGSQSGLTPDPAIKARLAQVLG